MDSQFYRDLRAPFCVSNVAAVTLAATHKALYGVANIPAMGKDYWWAGKTVRIRLFGQATTGATPGNITVAVFYGTGADNTGVSLQSSAAVALLASVTNRCFEIEVIVRCITPGATGTLYATGRIQFDAALVAGRSILIPDNAPVVSAACDLTVAGNVLTVQALRSGSTAETMQIVDMQVEALN